MKVTQALRDPRAVQDGVWMTPVPQSPEFRVRCRVRGPDYQRRISHMESEWQRIYGTRGAPDAIEHKVRSEILFDECIVAFEGLTDHAGEAPLPMEEAKALCGTFAGQPLYLHFLTAVVMAEARRASDDEAAEGNSSPSSAGT